MWVWGCHLLLSPYLLCTAPPAPDNHTHKPQLRLPAHPTRTHPLIPSPPGGGLMHSPGSADTCAPLPQAQALLPSTAASVNPTPTGARSCLHSYPKVAPCPSGNLEFLLPLPPCLCLQSYPCTVLPAPPPCPLGGGDMMSTHLDQLIHALLCLRSKHCFHLLLPLQSPLCLLSCCTMGPPSNPPAPPLPCPPPCLKT